MTQHYVQNLFIKQKRKAEMAIADSLNLVEDLGIVGDVNRDRLSPRQVLITCRADLEQLKIVPGELRENIVLDTAD
ncbi:MAG: hypothetical protein AAGK10_16810, partial [Cyanobacteria bacterium J06555_3]